MFTLNDAALINHKHDCACLGAHRSRNFSASRFREETRKSKHMLSEKLVWVWVYFQNFRTVDQAQKLIRQSLTSGILGIAAHSTPFSIELKAWNNVISTSIDCTSECGTTKDVKDPSSKRNTFCSVLCLLPSTESAYTSPKALTISCLSIVHHVDSFVFIKAKMAFIAPPANEKGVSNECNQGHWLRRKLENSVG